ncbi:TIGR02452 family protein [Streptomyces xanthophaeus]|uniref:Microbial-type PARG catalytic domain-containing protein n=1 Tax=Streptomyces xanthophaeus TaxID=67385 RepID=A0A919LCN2_9ACTN|nr:TIGR02452 family protein [Streptomyces xanthophaeus]GHI86075.1 hypothetical protein Sxan_34390 [Streptomyces xanthophaeus]
MAVLNFASARNSGSGYACGAKAQEKAPCRASTLYETLLEAPEYDEVHRAGRSTFYTDRVIHSPGGPFSAMTGANCRRNLPGRMPHLLGPLRGHHPPPGPERVAGIPQALARRAELVFRAAALHGYPRLVLGARGCGVFQNDPAVVAEAVRALTAGPF